MSNALYGKGTIKELAKGKYYLRFPIGKDPVTGKYRAHCETFNGTRRQAELRIEELRRGYAGGKAPNADKITYAELSADWLDARERRLKRGDLRPATVKQDRQFAKHIVSIIGNVRVADIAPYTVAKLYRKLEDDGIGETTVLGCHKQLKMVLDYAERNEIINRNPIDKMDRNEVPKTIRRSKTTLSEVEAKRLFDEALKERPSACSMAVLLALGTGMRRGEVLGLTWALVCLEGERPYLRNVQQFTKEQTVTLRKTDSKGRPIGEYLPLDRTTVELLRAWKAIQAQALSANGFIQTDQTPVCANTIGGFYNVDNFERDFRRFCIKHGFGRMVDDEGREIVRVDLDESGRMIGEPPEGARVEYYDSKGWPVDEHGRRFSRTNPRPAFKAHYEGLHPHKLRTTYFSLRRGEIDDRTLQEIGGWSSPRMLQEIYSQPVDERIWASAGFMDRLSGAK